LITKVLKSIHLRKFSYAFYRNGKYKADWESLKTYQIPQWYKNAKFGTKEKLTHWEVQVNKSQVPMNFTKRILANLPTMDTPN
jgi:hypothetical protein